MTNYVSNFNLLGENITIKDIEGRELINGQDIKITNTNNRIDNTNNEINQIILKRNPYSGTKVVLFGDSWLTQEKTLANTIGSNLNATVQNLGVGGAGFSEYATSKIITQINNARQDNDVKCVIIIGGVNDLNRGYEQIIQDQSSFLDDVQEAVQAAESKYPNAIVLLCYNNFLAYFPPKWKAILLAVHNRISGATKSVSFLNSVYITSRIEAWYKSDHIHLNSSGYQSYGGYITKFILSGENNITQDFGALTDVASGLNWLRRPYVYKINDKMIVTEMEVNFSATGTTRVTLAKLQYNFAAPFNGACRQPLIADDTLLGVIYINASGNLIVRGNGSTLAGARCNSFEWELTSPTK